MLSKNPESLEAEINEARLAVRDELKNELGLPAFLGGHSLAAPSIEPAQLSTPTSTDRDIYDSRPTNSQPQSDFFSKLPGEVRTLIYKECLGNGIVKFCPVKGYQKGARGANTTTAVPLLLSCRRIYQEALNVLYSANTWWLLNSTPLMLPAYLHRAQLNAIRHIVLHYHTTLPALSTNPMSKWEWLGTWHALSELEGLRTLDVTLYSSNTDQWPAYAQLEHELLRPIAAVGRLRRFSLTVRWPGQVDLATLLPCSEARREHKDRIAEGFYGSMVRGVTDFPHRYCLLGWEEDGQRNPESINECFPLRNSEGMRKGFLRTYRSMPKEALT